MISTILQFHDGMRKCARLNDRVFSGWFAVEQSLRQKCVAPLLFNIFFVAVINAAYMRFKADKERHHGRFGVSEGENGGGGTGGVTAGEPVLKTLLCGIFYADDAEAVSQSSKQLRKILEGIVVVCVAF